MLDLIIKPQLLRTLNTNQIEYVKSNVNINKVSFKNETYDIIRNINSIKIMWNNIEVHNIKLN